MKERQCFPSPLFFLGLSLLLLTLQFSRFDKALLQVSKQELLEFLGGRSKKDSILNLLLPNGCWIRFQ